MDHRILSIQSHVVCGYVGNRSVVFPLQVLGFEVDFINSVQFSNHTWYKVVKGQILDADQLSELYEGLTGNGLDNYNYIMTGYIGSTSFLERVAEIIKDQKKKNPTVKYLCDPVMGDHGKLYVPAELLPIYRETIVSLADIIVPNEFEAELLTGVKIANEADALEAMNKLHQMGVGTVVLSSSDFGDANIMIGYASRLNQDGKKCQLRMNIPRFDAQFVGSGDLFAALLVSWLERHPDDLKLVCMKVIGTMQVILRRTLDSAIARLPPGQTPTCGDLELRLVQSLDDIRNPQCHKDVEDL